MDADKQNALMTAGLTLNEAKVYLALLELGSSTANDITRRAGVHRVNCYDVLERLLKKGLLSLIVRGQKRIYEAADPSQLHHLLKEKEELLLEALPSLKAEFGKSKQHNVTHHFSGVDGVLQAYFMALDQKKTMYALGGSGINRKYLKHRHEMWNKERKKRRLKIKALYYEFTRKEKEKGWHDADVEIRYIPDTFRTQGMVDICGNLVINLIPDHDDINAIVIESKTLADTYRKFFHFMWQYSKK